MNIDELVDKFATTPFLFLGSGITRRYYNLPDWKGLLDHFAREVNNDDFSLTSYINRAEKLSPKAGVLAKAAELIQIDYDEKWFNDPSIRHANKAFYDDIKNGKVSPFKAEIAQYISDASILDNAYKEEVDMLSELSAKHISGVITTNYDNFIESVFNGYSKYVGQKQLIFSAIQGLAEIYKIHGSVESPDSIVINEKDYIDFQDNCEYLAAKLMTIFMEYPIIFIGYSLSDTNIQNILKSIVNCLDEKQLKMLEDRFVFVDYQQSKVGIEITPYTIMFGNKPLSMKRIIVSDFKLVYSALHNKRSTLPVKILRRFKQELYEFTLTNKPTAKLYVSELDDPRIIDDDLVLSIGKYGDVGVKGIKGLTPDEWYTNIILENLRFSSDDILENAFPVLYNQNSKTLPLNKYLHEASKDFPDCRSAAASQNFDSIISNTIKKNRKCINGYSSVKQIWTIEKDSLNRATSFIAHLTEEQIDVNELESVLREIFTNDPNVLSNKTNQALRTNVKRLIRIYDFLKWGKGAF